MKTITSQHWNNNTKFVTGRIQPRAPYDFYHPHDFLPVRPSKGP